MRSVRGRVLPYFAIAAASMAATSAFAQGQVNVYTYRESKLIQPLFDAFTKDTGIKVNVVSASSGLEQRIRTEGANSPADVLLTVDINRLEDAVRAGKGQRGQACAFHGHPPVDRKLSAVVRCRPARLQPD